MEENVRKIPGKKNNFNNEIMHGRGEISKKPISLTTLILWNVKKALEMNPAINFKSAMKEVERQLEPDGRDVSVMLPEFPEERHLVCAMLAWQQLGHSDADSLCRFVENEQNSRESESVLELTKYQDKSFGESQKDINIFTLESFSGPVVKLPTEPKIVMRVQNTGCQGCGPGIRDKEKDILNKIQAACCKLNSSCADKLTGMDNTLKDLRKRAKTLGKREAERVLLLERAEAAWRDLERGYKRRLTLSEEKEEELTKQLHKLISDRQHHKNSSMMATQQLKTKEEVVDRDKKSLAEIEKELSDRACNRQKLIEESARLDALLTEQQCKASQLERDCMFKEEQFRRKMGIVKSELESAQAMTHEAERTMRMELTSLRDQVLKLSDQLTAEDAENGRINMNLTVLREEKMEMIEDLEGCKELCDGKMQHIADEIVLKQGQLDKLKAQVLDCRCKLPQDANVEAKRTPSLVALCCCTPEQKIFDSCSCTSIRGRIMTNLLTDLFGGLQSELEPSGSVMPCQLLKCLEDKHNWDRASIVKTNLKNFFAGLLVGELDIAIANSIERYHAKWVGETCADVVSKMKTDPDISKSEEGWQQRVIERRAQKLATELAEQLFQEKADELTKKAKDLMALGPPPCECKKKESSPVSQQTPCKGRSLSAQSIIPKPCKDTKCCCCYTCLVPKGPKVEPRPRSKSFHPWERAIQNVTQLRLEIEDLKKDSIKKNDLKKMEFKIAKIVQRCNDNNQKDSDTYVDDVMRNLNKSICINDKHSPTQIKSNQLKKKHIDEYSGNKNGNKLNSKKNTEIDKTFKPNKKFGQTYAINTCFCSQKDPNKILQLNKAQNLQKDEMRKNSMLKNPKDLLLKLSKPISASLLSEDIMSPTRKSNTKKSEENVRPNHCNCFHKAPSNTSIDILLETLLKWKNDLNNTEGKGVVGKSCPCPASKEQIRGSVSSGLKCLKKEQSSTNKHEINDNLNKYDLPQKSSQHILKLCKSPERANYDIKLRKSLDEAKLQNVQNPNTVNCKNNTLTKSTIKGEIDFNAKIDNLKTHRSTVNKVITTGIPENKYNTRSNIDRKVSHNSNKVNLNASPLDKINTLNDEPQCIIPTTESEYLGAVNLDKSNEEVCKPIDTSVINPFQCLLSSKCSCDKVLISKSSRHEILNTKCEPSNTDVFENNAKNESGCNSNYNIKFLGVTLAEVKPKMKLVDDLPTIKKIYSKGKENKKKDEHKKYIKSETPTTNLSSNDSDNLKKDVNSKSEKTEQKITKMTTRSCECNTTVDKFKNCIDIALQYESSNNDKSLDIQSFINTDDETMNSCICCDNNNGDKEESNNLENNAFQLLEEHLKQRLEEFKKNSCQSSCITPHEEEKLFSVILKQVKKIISDSTNNISCKCNVKDGEGHGSWNRAFSLLQEYLRIKIKRVQCSCSSAKDDKDTVLPDVLNKVCNLIDTDFQRLKDVCDCQTAKEPQKTEVQKNVYKQEHFKYETPEKDTNTDLCLVIDKPYLILEGKPIIRENVLLQVSNFLGMDTKSCDPIEISKTDNSQNSQSFERQPACYISQKRAESENLDRKKVRYSVSNSAEEHLYKAMLATNTKFNNECQNSEIINDLNIKKTTNLHLPQIRCSVGCASELSKNFLYDCNKPLTGKYNTNVKKYENDFVDKLPNSKSFESCLRQSFPNCDLSCKSSPEEHCTITSENTECYSNGQYLGYTIDDCSYDPEFGKCVCTKSPYNPKLEINIIKSNKSVVDKNVDQLSHIRDKPKFTIDSYKRPLPCLCPNRHEFGTKMSNHTDDDMVILQDFKSNIKVANTMTNTYDDNNSIVTDNSNYEPSIDWCDCCTTEKNEVQNQLKKSMHFPVPMENSEEAIKHKVRCGNSDGNQMNRCNCEMVPICHVKLLVENIETNLANSKCTCDSMLSKVCPIHSHQ